MCADTEIQRMVYEFARGFCSRKKLTRRHHEQTKSNREQFAEDARSLVTAIEQMGNPFTDDIMELLNMNSKVIMPEKSYQYSQKQ